VVKSRRRQERTCEVEGGHITAALCHMANISYRTGRLLEFDAASEKFRSDEEANRYLSRDDRSPYTVP
jgi:hypothetical protein